VLGPLAMAHPTPFFVWKPAFDLAIPTVDAEHRRFFEIMNELYAAMVRGQGDAVVHSTLRRLVEYATRHFAGEEEFLAGAGYPELHVQIQRQASMSRHVPHVTNSGRSVECAPGGALPQESRLCVRSK
jgi:hemerythrin-like metal-binding protein